MSENYVARGVAYNSKAEADLAAEIPSVYLDRAEDAGFIAEAVIDSEWLRRHDAEILEGVARMADREGHSWSGAAATSFFQLADRIRRLSPDIRLEGDQK